MLKLPREAIQPAPENLLNYDRYVAHLRQLATSPRVKIETIGHSIEGRGLHAIIIADEQALPHLDYHRTLAAQIERPQVTHKTLADRQTKARPTPPADLRYPALVLAHTFGHEAAHLEGLLMLADRLAWENDAEVSAILSKLIVVIDPLANPDGREAALKRWAENRLGDDGPNAGDHYGFYVNRDLLHLTQPEGAAPIKLYRDWHPIAAYDVHEDGYVLSVTTPEICWAPAFGNANGGDIPDNLQAIIQKMADAILVKWEAHGFNYLRGDMFGYPMPGHSDDEPQWFASGNAISMMGLHGVPAVITESSRSPGSQTWEDRLVQKYSAGMALLGETARSSAAIVDTIYNNAQADVESAGTDAFILPKTQTDLAALRKAIDVLLQQGVQVYQTDDAYVVPLAQAESRIARNLLSSAESKQTAVPPAVGLKSLRLSLLPADQRAVYERSLLASVSEAPAPILRISGAPAAVITAAIPNTTEGVRLLNRLWPLNLPIYWLTEAITVDGETLAPGTFIVENLPTSTLRALERGLALDLVALPAQTSISGRRLHAPQVAIYIGQGADRPDSAPKAEMWYALEQLEFDFVPLFGPQMRASWLARKDLLLMPDGSAGEIVSGWQDSGRETWGAPGIPDGIGDEGLKAIRAFVEAGGAYLGLGSGGGMLATDAYAGLIDLTVAHQRLGSGRAVVRIHDASNPLIYGLDNGVAEDGSPQPGVFPAMYYSEGLTGGVGGPVFKAGAKAQAVALFDHIDYDPTLHVVLHPEYFDLQENAVAVAQQTYGKGTVTVLGVRPGFRAIWTQSEKLITNAIFEQVADAASPITLA